MQAIGVDLGGTKINIGVISHTGQIIDSAKYATPIARGGEAILGYICDLILELKSTYGNLPVGIGTPGLVDFENGRIVGCTPNLPDWDTLPLKDRLAELTSGPVYVDNDASVATWGEFRVGKGKGLQHMVLLTLGTGLGSGIISFGQLKRAYGTFGIGFGHMIVEASGRFCNCGQRGCLETYVSGTGLGKTYQLLGGEKKPGALIFQDADAGEPLAQKAIQTTLKYLALGVSNILNTLAPDKILLSGGLAEQGEKKLLVPLVKEIKAIMSMPFNHPEAIEIASLGSQAGLIGAALLAMDEEHNGARRKHHN